ncbi:Ankyrin-like protein [Rhodopirellula islandica]|uniref:Ankyrin-like protein n=1 Tax=Rhodopirellula islandica TaxID=595434 RepID=A0A0J1BIF2_RHOIS|nr:Ankyrin-like protein [Rhodopirellula islandica]
MVSLGGLAAQADDGSDNTAKEQEYRRESGLLAGNYFHHPLDIQLCEAIEANDLTAIRSAIASGANVNASGLGGVSPLIWSSLYQRFARFELLLVLGADPNAPFTSEPSLSIHRSVMHDFPGETATCFAAKTGYDGYLELVLEHEADLRTMDDSRRSIPLQIMWARGGNRMGRMNAFVKHGGDINLPSGWGNNETCSVHAITREAFSLAVMLFELGGDPNLPVRYGPGWGLPIDLAVFPLSDDSLVFSVPFPMTQRTHDRILQNRRALKRLIAFLEAAGFSSEEAIQRARKRFDPTYGDLSPDGIAALLASTEMIPREEEHVTTIKDLRASNVPLQVIRWREDTSHVGERARGDEGIQRPLFPLTEAKFRQHYGVRAERFFQSPSTLELCAAIIANDPGQIREAVKNGADVNDVGFAGMTPLLFAFPFQRTERIQALLDLGADPTLRLTSYTGVPGLTMPGLSVLTEASTSSSAEIFERIVASCESQGLHWTTHKHWSGMPMLHAIVSGLESERIAKIKRFQAGSGDLHRLNEDGCDAAMLAIFLSDCATAQHLIEAGMDLNRRNQAGDHLPNVYYRYESASAVEKHNAAQLKFETRLVAPAKELKALFQRKGYRFDDQAGRIRRGEIEDDIRREADEIGRKVRGNAERLRFNWYPRQEFVGSGDLFRDDRYDLRKVFDCQMPVVPEHVPGQLASKVGLDPKAVQE